MKLFVLLFFLVALGPTSCFSQNCEVEIRTLKKMEEPEGYRFIGEDILKKVSANSIEDLSDKQLQKITKTVAKYGYCIVYVDFNNLAKVDNGLYFVWTNENPAKE